jgi:MerR family transcriptional regulator, light-induced transcriptional regulator
MGGFCEAKLNSMPLLYPIRAASKLTGIPIDTLRAWERRYRAVTPARVNRGRLYSEDDIKRLVLLRTAVEGGHTIGRAARLSNSELAELATSITATSAQQPVVPGHLRPFLAAIEAFDYAKANEELARIAMLANQRALVYDIVLPLMKIAGDNWACGEFRVFQEHLVSACVRNLLGGLIRTPHARPASLRLLFTTPAGELHEFGVLAAAMLSIAYDFQATYLGPNLPAVEIISASAGCSPHAAVLGILEPSVTNETAREISALAAGLRSPTELWLGGAGAQTVLAMAECKTDGLEILALENFAQFEEQLGRLKLTARAYN